MMGMEQMDEDRPLPNVIPNPYARTLERVLNWTGHPRRCPLCAVFHQHECTFQQDIRGLLEWLFNEDGIARLQEYLTKST